MIQRKKKPASPTSRRRQGRWLHGRALFSCSVLVCLLGTGHLARASENDYNPKNNDWNGLSTLFQMAKGRGLEVQVSGTLDFQTLSPKSCLLILYPTLPLAKEELTSFLGAGGMVILADDYGASEPFLNSFGITRLNAGDVSLRALYRKSPAHPIPKPHATSHPLAEGVERLVLNHPSFFQSRFKPVFSFEGPGTGIVLSLTVGSGHLVVISDPSLFINLMLQFPNNRRFTENLLASVTGKGLSRLLILTHNYESVGVYEPPGEPPPSRDTSQSLLAQFARDFKDLLAEWTMYRLDLDIIIPIAVLLCGAILVLLASRLPIQKVFYDGHWTSTGERPPVGRFFSRMLAYTSEATRDFTEPACLLRDQLDRELEKRLETPSPIMLLKLKAVARLIEKKYGAEAADRYRQLFAQVRGLPPTDRLKEPKLRLRLPKKKLQRIDTLGRQLLERMDTPTIG